MSPLLEMATVTTHPRQLTQAEQLSATQWQNSLREREGLVVLPLLADRGGTAVANSRLITDFFTGYLSEPKPTFVVS